ncbi:MAG: hypothetical protein IT176_02875 [Acidobacteria bacterium]|nr:hypothetical protein [Acidobacteriota bacterium]
MRLHERRAQGQQRARERHNDGRSTLNAGHFASRMMRTAPELAVALAAAAGTSAMKGRHFLTAVQIEECRETGMFGRS